MSDDQIVIVRFDPTAAAKIYRRKNRPANCRRQATIRYLGRDGEEELFQIAQVVPTGEPGHRPASPSQHDVVHDFYGVMLPEDTCHQVAHELLCVRDYAEAVASSFPFAAQRRALLARLVAAYLTRDPLLRDSVRRWCCGFEHCRPPSSSAVPDRGLGLRLPCAVVTNRPLIALR